MKDRAVVIENLTRQRDEACARLIALMQNQIDVNISLSLSDLEECGLLDLCSHSCTFAAPASPSHTPMTATNRAKNKEGPPPSTLQNKITACESSLYSMSKSRRASNEPVKRDNPTKSPSPKTSMIQAAGDLYKSLTSFALGRTTNKTPRKSSTRISSLPESGSEQTFVECIDTDRPIHREHVPKDAFQRSAEGHRAAHKKPYHPSDHFSQSFTYGNTGRRHKKPNKEISSSRSCLDDKAEKDQKDLKKLMELFQLAKESGAVVEVGPESPQYRCESPCTTYQQFNMSFTPCKWNLKVSEAPSHR